DARLRIVAEEPHQAGAERSPARAVMEADPHYRSASGRRRLEPHGAGVRGAGVIERPPRELFPGPVGRDLRGPLQARGHRPLRHPAGAALVELVHGLEALHEAREILEAAPEAVALLGRLADRNAELEIDVGLTPDPRNR